MPLPPGSDTLSVGSVLSILLNTGVVFAPAFQIGAAVTVLALLARLSRAGLLAKYWAISLFMAADAAVGILTTLGGRQAIGFQQGGAALHVALATFIFWEMSRRVFRNYPALAEFSTRSMKYILPLCALLGVAAFLTDPEVPPGRSPHLHLVNSIDRAITSALLTYLVATAAFAGWFPVRMSRNVARLLIGFMAIFATRWAGSLIANAAPDATAWANVLQACATLAAAFYWAIVLNAQGEVEEAATVPQWDPDRLAQMTQQLDQMQAQLSRRGY